MDVKPGDLIFYPDDGNWKHAVFGWLQKIGGEIGSWSGKPITHVAMISTEPDLIVEMKWPRPKFRLYADDLREKIVMRPKCDNVTKMRAIYWCYFNIEAHYSFLEMLLGKFGFTSAYKVCSGWVDRAYDEAGYPLVNVKDKLVSPCELIGSEFLEKVA